MLINAENIAFSYGGKRVIDGACFSVNEGERIGLIGENGAGKTTLVRLMLGQLEPDAGTVVLRNGIRIGYLEQVGGYTGGSTVYGEMLAVFKEELAAIDRLDGLCARLSDLDASEREYAVVSAKIESLNRYIAAHDCYNIEVRIKNVLNGMGFSSMYENRADSLSGGEKTRLKLARLLLEEPDLLVLDEPTNHLDISTLFWLEEYLSSYRGAVFTVSHDRYFLDKTAEKIAELENGELLFFSGNYSKYKVLKAELTERRRREYEAQQREIAKLQDYIDRNIARATTAKSAQSRVKQLERMDVLQKPYTPPRAPVFRFLYDGEPYERVLTAAPFDLEAGGKRLITGGQLEIKRGEKVALVGENGTGKSTLLKYLLSGTPAVTTGRYVKCALYDQENLNLHMEDTVLAELWERHTGYSQTEARAALARAGLTAGDTEKRVCELSGGERAKLALCVLECERANFLIMDEPTNHLDLPAREALEQALKEFGGTLLFVSHDRYFISALADRVIEIENCSLCCFDGGYEGYLNSKREISRRQAETARAEELIKLQNGRAESVRSRNARAAAERKKNEIKRIEALICAAEEEQEDILTRLADPDVAADYRETLRLSERLRQLERETEELYAEYLALEQ